MVLSCLDYKSHTSVQQDACCVFFCFFVFSKYDLQACTPFIYDSTSIFESNLGEQDHTPLHFFFQCMQRNIKAFEGSLVLATDNVSSWRHRLCLFLPYIFKSLEKYPGDSRYSLSEGITYILRSNCVIFQLQFHKTQTVFQ